MNQALTLLVVGMLTVFIILSLVVILGKVLIWYVNKYVPEKDIRQPVSEGGKTDLHKVAAIMGAVDIITTGRGYVKKIDKVDE